LAGGNGRGFVALAEIASSGRDYAYTHWQRSAAGPTPIASISANGDHHQADRAPFRGGWRVFISHTSELRTYPERGYSYIDRVERAVSMAGHASVVMANFAAQDRRPSEACVADVKRCQVYVGVLGARYGMPVREQPELSHVELEYNTATELDIPRLLFLLDPKSQEHRLPPDAIQDHDHGSRQAAFRQRVQDHDGGRTVQFFRNPDDLGAKVYASLRQLEEERRGGQSPTSSEASVPSRGRDGMAWLLPHLPDRHAQEQPWKALLNSLSTGEKDGPFLVVSHGYENQEVGMFRHRLEHHIIGKSFPHIQPDFAITGWPELSQLRSGQPFASFSLKAQDLLPTAMLDAPLVLITTTYTHDWRHDPGAFLAKLFQFWQTEPAFAGKPLIHWVSIQYKTPELESPRFLRAIPWLWPGYWACRRLNVRLRQSLHHLHTPEPRPQLVVLPEFQSIRRADAEDWARSEAVSEGLGQSSQRVVRLFQEVERIYVEGGHSHIPMGELSAKLKEKLQSLMP
jgi:hypothetical protein